MENVLVSASFQVFPIRCLVCKSFFINVCCCLLPLHPQLMTLCCIYRRLTVSLDFSHMEGLKSADRCTLYTSYFLGSPNDLLISNTGCLILKAFISLRQHPMNGEEFSECLLRTRGMSPSNKPEESQANCSCDSGKLIICILVQTRSCAIVDSPLSRNIHDDSRSIL